MQCPQCQYENLPDSVFCPECGTKLARLCSRCGAENRLTSKFCRKCGTPLTKGEKGKREKGEKENRQSDPRTSDPALWTPPHLAERIRAEQAAEEARQMLAEVYGWFTEGFDAPDLKDAKTLLEELEGKGTITPGKKRKSAEKQPGRKGRTGRKGEMGKRGNGGSEPK